MINMSIKKTLEILVLELMYPTMGKMGLNAYYFSARSYQYIEHLAEQVFTLVIGILPVGRV